jgi:hypothetical protein
VDPVNAVDKAVEESVSMGEITVTSGPMPVEDSAVVTAFSAELGESTML